MNDDLDVMRALVRLEPRPCPACRRPIAALDAPTCGACGATLELALGSSDRAPAAWVATLVGAAAPIGFAAPLLFFLWHLSRRAGLQSAVTRVALVLGVMLALHAVLTVLAIVRRRRLWRLPTGRRRTVAAAALALPFIEIAVLLLVRYM